MDPRRLRVTYSLWLMPAGDLYYWLADTILDLSRKYSTPTFEPHVTLLARISGPERKIVSKSAELAQRISPFTLRLTRVDYLDRYYQCVFVRVATRDPLVKAHRAAREVFGLEKSPAFIPHLSLVYGDLARDVKERIVAELGWRFESTFKARSLDLVLTRGEPSAWRRLRGFGLKD
jgi:2'-5' RNA ligase